MIISLWNRPRKKVTALRVAIGKAVEEELGKIERRGRPKAEHPDQESLIEEGEIRENFPELSGKRTDEIAAKTAGFGNRKTYQQAKTVTEKATPELVAAMDQGTIAISTAAKLAGQTPDPKSMEEEEGSCHSKGTKWAVVERTIQDYPHNHEFS